MTKLKIEKIVQIENFYCIFLFSGVKHRSKYWCIKTRLVKSVFKIYRVYLVGQFLSNGACLGMSESQVMLRHTKK